MLNLNISFLIKINNFNTLSSIDNKLLLYLSYEVLYNLNLNFFKLDKETLILSFLLTSINFQNHKR